MVSNRPGCAPGADARIWPMSSLRRVGWGLSLVMLLGAVWGCGSDSVASVEDEAAIRSAIEAYLPQLAEAYKRGDASVLEGFAAEKEIAGLDKRIRDMLAESREIHPTFKSVIVEDAHVWSAANAFATTLEVWDLRVMASGTDRVLSEAIDQRNRVKYQLKKVDGAWIVLFRELESTFE